MTAESCRLADYLLGGHSGRIQLEADIGAVSCEVFDMVLQVEGFVLILDLALQATQHVGQLLDFLPAHVADVHQHTLAILRDVQLLKNISRVYMEFCNFYCCISSILFTFFSSSPSWSLVSSGGTL